MNIISTICKHIAFGICLLSSIFLSSCSFETLENGITPAQLSAVDTTTRGSGGSFQWSIGSDNYSSTAKYNSSTKVLSAKIDADNYLEFTFAASTPSLTVGNYSFASVAIVPGSVSVSMKQRKSDNTGFISYGVGINGNFQVESIQDSKLKGSFSFSASAAQLYTGTIIQISTSGKFSDVPMQ